MSDEEMFDDVLEASTILEEMPDLSRADAWVSSALGLWADRSDAEVVDRAFLEWLTKSDAPRADRLAEAVNRLVDPASVDVSATDAWSAEVDGAVSIGVGFLLEDGSEHSLLADVDEGRLFSLVAAPPPAELFGDGSEAVHLEPANVVETCSAIAVAWDGLVAAGVMPPEDMLANLALGRARLSVVLGDTAGFGRVGSSIVDNTTVVERDRELDAWALQVLDGAGVGAGSEPDESVLAPLDASRWGAFTASEREAFAAIEWADWLGIAIELDRAVPGQVVDGGILVDMVNRCPEVTSSIPKRERQYYEWVFSLLIDTWVEAGLVDSSGVLSADGADRLVGALRQHWA